MARLLNFMFVILCIAVTLDVGFSARYLRDSFDLTSEEEYTPSTSSYYTDRSGARNLGGLVGMKKPDLSKFGLPPLPDFNPLDFVKQLTSGDLLKGLSKPSSSGSGGAGVSATGSGPAGNARNLGGLSLLSGLQKPDLSKLGLPPLPDFVSLAKRFSSGGSATPNARHLGGLPKLPKIPDSPLDLLPKPFPLNVLPKLEIPELPIELLPEQQRPFDLLPKPELPFDLPFEIPKPFDLNSFLSNIFARKLDYDGMLLKRAERTARLEAKEKNARAPAPAPAQKKKPSTSPSGSPSVQQQMPNTKPVPQQQQQLQQQPQQPMNLGMPQGNSGGQQPMNLGMPQGNSGGQQPMNLGMPQGMPNQMQP